MESLGTRRTVVILLSLLGVVLGIVVAMRVLGPFRPLEDLVLDRLGNGGPAALFDHNPTNSSRSAQVTWNIHGDRLMVSVYQQHGDEPLPVIETRSFNGVKTDSLSLEPNGQAWHFRCNLNSALYDYGTMEVALFDVDNAALVVPEVHRFLKCS